MLQRQGSHLASLGADYTPTRGNMSLKGKEKERFILPYIMYGDGGVCADQKRVSDLLGLPLELELQVIRNYLGWLLGTKVRFSARAMYALNC